MQESGRKAMRVAVVEDQPLFRAMLVGLLRDQADVEVVFSAGDVATAKRTMPVGRVDVAVLDVQLPDGDGLELGLWLRQAAPAIGIVLLSSQDVMDVLLSLPAGTREGWSYLSKTSSTSVASIMRALHASATGRTVLDPELVERSVPRAGSAIAGLTPRQLDALKLLAEGMSNKAIAEQLSISTHSVDNLLNSLYSALGLSGEPARNPRVSAVLQLLDGSSRALQPTL